MFKEISIVKGIYPGLILDPNLEERDLQVNEFALSIDEPPEMLNGMFNKIVGDLKTAQRLTNQWRQFFCYILNHLAYSKLEYGIRHES